MCRGILLRPRTPLSGSRERDHVQTEHDHLTVVFGISFAKLSSCVP